MPSVIYKWTSLFPGLVPYQGSVLHSSFSAVHRNQSSCHIAEPVACDTDHNITDLLRFTGAVHRDQRIDIIRLLMDGLCHQCRIDHTGGYCIHPDTVGRQLGCSSDGEKIYTGCLDAREEMLTIEPLF